jgi:PAS domain S-box-containing protein
MKDNKKDTSIIITKLEKELAKYKYSEEALRESESRFKLLAEIAPVGIFRTEANGSTNYVNPYWCKISGMSFNEAIGNGWLEAVHPEDKVIIEKNWKQKATKKETSSAEYRFIRPDGSISWVIGNAIPHKDNSGKISGYIGTITDVTQLKTAEEALNKRLEGETILSAISSRFINIDADNLDNEFNKALEQIGMHADVDRSYVFLISEDEKHISNTNEWCRKGISKQIENLQNVSVKDAPWWMKELKKLSVIKINSVDKLPKSAHREKELFKSQDIKSILAFPMIISNKLIGFLGFDYVRKEKVWTSEETILLNIFAEVFVNALKRINSEQKLRESEEKNRAIVSALPDLFFRIDKNSVFLDCSMQHSDKFYLPADQFMGKKVTAVLPHDISEIIKDRIAEAYKTRELQIFNYPLNYKGEEKWFEARMIPAINDELLIIVRDITETRNQQRKLEQKNEELERYAYTVSHDLKSPLITINGFANFLLKDIKNKNFKNVPTDLQRIINASNKLSNMLDELLEISKAGQIVNKTDNIPLGRIIKEVIDMLSITIQKKKAKIIVSRRLPVVSADINRIKDVMQNLIENALKYSRPNINPIIEIGYRIEGSKKIIFVKDNGIGIHPDYKIKIFGLFTKFKNKSKGSGIGLALSKRIIEAHNGSIWVESDGIDKGSTFCFFIPKKPY